MEISQVCVAIQLRCGGMFNNDFVANLLLSLPVKELWKSVSIWRSYGQKYSVLVFNARCNIYVSCLCYDVSVRLSV